MKPRPSKMFRGEVEEKIDQDGDTMHRIVMRMPDGSVQTGEWWFSRASLEEERVRLHGQAVQMWKKLSR